MKKAKHFILMLLMSLGFLTAYAYDFSLEKPVIVENYFPSCRALSGTASGFDMKSTNATYTQYVVNTVPAQITLRELINFGEIDGADGAITLTYQNTSIPLDSLSTSQQLGTFDIYLDDAKVPLVSVPAYMSKIKVNGVLTVTQLTTTAIVAAMPTGRHAISVFFNGQKSTLFNVKIESNGNALNLLNAEGIDVVTTAYPTGQTGGAPVNLPFRMPTFVSDGNILVYAVQFPMTPKSNGGNNMNTTGTRGGGGNVDIGWVSGDGRWFNAGSYDLGQNKEYVSVTLKINPNKLTTINSQVYQLFTDTMKVGLAYVLTKPLAIINFANGYTVDRDGWFVAETFFNKDSIPVGIHNIYVKAITGSGDIRAISFRKLEPVSYDLLNATIATANALPLDLPASIGLTSGYSYPADIKAAFTTAIANAQTMVTNNTAVTQVDVSAMIISLNAATANLKNSRIFTATGDDFIIYPADYVGLNTGAGNLDATAKYITSATVNSIYFVGNVDFGATGSYLSSSSMTARQYSEGGGEYAGSINGSYYQLLTDSVKATPISSIPLVNSSSINGTTFVQSSDTMKVVTGVHKLYIKWIGSTSNLMFIDLSTTNLTRFYPLQLALSEANAISLDGKAAVVGSSSGYGYAPVAKSDFSTQLAAGQSVFDAQTALSPEIATNTQSVRTSIANLRASRTFTIVSDSTAIYAIDFMGKVSGTGVYENANNVGSTAANLIWYVGNVDFGNQIYQNAYAITSRKYSITDPTFTTPGALGDGINYQLHLDSVAILIPSPFVNIPLINTSTTGWASYVHSSGVQGDMSKLSGVHKLYIKWVGANSNLKNIGFALVPTALKNVSGDSNFKIYSVDKTIFVKGNIEGATLDIFSLTGIKLYSKAIKSSEVSTKMQSGVYVVRVSSPSEGVTTGKVIIE